MEKTRQIYSKVLSILRTYDLKYKKSYLEKRSNEIINHYDKSLEYFQKRFKANYDQEKLKDIHDLINKQKYSLDELVKDIQNPLLLGITGVGNSGKSSFINSILKKDIAKVNKRAETWLINIISYIKDETKSGDGYLYYEGESSLFKTNEEIKQVFRKEDEAFKKSKKKKRKLRRELKEKDFPVHIREKREQEIENKYSYVSDLYKIKRYHDK
mgnify:CR=1 FL=1